ncbi:unnamed protein product [Rotaria sordida]|uniref:Uncharacterized protein n=1 Tax=Rotaria sordida TaxID=392033 RepID=A0A815GBT8_9BILA|nr:unnamed protein product [Rotaria sordida]
MSFTYLELDNKTSMINIHHHTMIHIIGMEIIQIRMIFMVQHSSHTLLQQNDFTQQVYLKYKQQYLDEDQ